MKTRHEPFLKGNWALNLTVNNAATSSTIFKTFRSFKRNICLRVKSWLRQKLENPMIIYFLVVSYSWTEITKFVINPPGSQNTQSSLFDRSRIYFAIYNLVVMTLEGDANDDASTGRRTMHSGVARPFQEFKHIRMHVWIIRTYTPTSMDGWMGYRFTRYAKIAKGGNHRNAYRQTVAEFPSWGVNERASMEIIEMSAARDLSAVITHSLYIFIYSLHSAFALYKDISVTEQLEKPAYPPILKMIFFSISSNIVTCQCLMAPNIKQV